MVGKKTGKMGTKKKSSTAKMVPPKKKSKEELDKFLKKELSKKPRVKKIKLPEPSPANQAPGLYIFQNDRLAEVNDRGGCVVVMSVPREEFELHFSPEFDDDFEKYWSVRLFGADGAVRIRVALLGKPVVQEERVMMVVKCVANVAEVKKTLVKKA